MLHVSGVSSIPQGSRSYTAPNGAVPHALAHLMSQHLDTARPRSDAEALRMLRQAFPAVPLAARVAAMACRVR